MYCSPDHLKSKFSLLPVWSQRSSGGGLKRLKAFLRESGLSLPRPKRVGYLWLGRKIPTPLSAMVWGFCGNRSCFYDKDSKGRTLCVQAFEVKITLGEASNLTVTEAQPQHTDYGCWFWSMTAVGFGWACPEITSYCTVVGAAMELKEKVCFVVQ